MNEDWKPVIGHEDSHEVSSLGEIRSLDRVITQVGRWGKMNRQCRGVALSPSTDSYGYKVVEICQKTRKVHQLVLEAFVGPRLDNTECCHNDGDKANNNLNNLRWDSHENNMADYSTHRRTA